MERAIDQVRLPNQAEQMSLIRFSHFYHQWHQ